MPYILSKADRRVLRYFNKYGFEDVELTLFILDTDSNWLDVLELEQFLINNLDPNLNVDRVAGGFNGYHEPMFIEARDRLIKLRGTPIYLYDTFTTSLIFISDSKQWLYDNIKIHHLTLNNCLISGDLYLNRFFFSLDPILEFRSDSLLSNEKLIDLIKISNLEFKPFQPASKKIFAENYIKPELSQIFSSINEVSLSLKVDRSTVRNHINGKSNNLYKKEWKFFIIND